MNRVITIPALGDNYIYLYQNEEKDAFVVDPGESRSVFETLKEEGLNLKAAILTHNHFDHTGGVADLKSKTGCRVRQPQVDLADGDVLEICSAKIEVIETPGHTRNSVCYYVRPDENHDGFVFTGDTLFIGGCGRIIEADAKMMWNSLQKIAALPDKTLIYPGHDYTQENYEFALQTVPENEILKKRLQEIRECQRQGCSSVPSTIAQEKATNIFLLASNPEIKSAIGMPNAADTEVFVRLRKQKDIFG